MASSTSKRVRSIGVLSFVATCALANVANVAKGDEDHLAACNAALVQGQELARGGKLLAARAAYPPCLRAECAESLRAVCANFIAELGSRIPSLSVEIRSPRGGVPGARLLVDGTLAANPASPVEVDPGVHVVRVEAPNHVAKEETITVAEGARPRSVVMTLSPISLESPGRATPPAARPGLPASVYVLGTTSAIAIGSFTYFALHGNHTESNLRASCPAGPCDSSPMRREFLAADVSLGVALVAAGLALWIAVTRAPGPAPRQAFAF